MARIQANIIKEDETDEEDERKNCASVEEKRTMPDTSILPVEQIAQGELRGCGIRGGMGRGCPLSSLGLPLSEWEHTLTPNPIPKAKHTQCRNASTERALLKDNTMYM